MGSDYAGGYIFFSALRDRQALIDLVLRTMELTPEDKLGIWLPRDDDHYPSNLPNEQALYQLAQAEDGGIVVKVPHRPEWYEFDKPAGPYQTVAVSCITNALSGRINPGGGDLLARRWLTLCEEGKADFGFFSEFEIIEIEQRDALLPALLQKDAQKLMENWGSADLSGTRVGPVVAGTEATYRSNRATLAAIGSLLCPRPYQSL